ncbi:hypothetical protein XI06_03895 [Bradyrhizobium sp. CCBAU 11434]|nr:hypothetical protein [Bradyrhizobium sp. CCBAU 11434]
MTDRVTKQELLDLALMILRDVEKVVSSIDQHLLEMRACGQEMSAQRQLLPEASQDFSKVPLQ